jgi:G3E family GTPase
VLWDSKLPGYEDREFEIHRSKGRLVFDDGKVKILQGVQEIFELMEAPEDVKATEKGKIILIGKHIADLDFESSFRDTVR